jgi:hypothetical protein
VRHIASKEVACLRIERTKVVSVIELGCMAGEARPIVARFAEIARGKA